MEFSIRTVMIFIILLIAALFIAALMMGMGGDAGNLLSDIFDIFRGAAR